MTHRIVAAGTMALVVAGGIAALVVAGGISVGSAWGQTKPSSSKSTLPRTADGHPVLEGIWTNATLTPLERPAQFAGKAILTEQEVARFEKQELNNVDGDRRDGARDADVNRAYNEFWRDRGRVVPDHRSSLIVDPPDGRVPALTPEAKKRVDAAAARNRGHEFDGPENRSLAERCIAVPNAGPPMLPANYNANYQIVQTPGYVALVSEQIHDARVIPTNGRPHPPATVREFLGDSTGHWEGDTLVVDTANFDARTNFRGAGENLHVIERFTRTAADTVMYEFTIDDPTTFTKSWTARIPLHPVAGPLYEYACHEGNYGLAGSLSGARVEERSAHR
jgi:hypothetical protein